MFSDKNKTSSYLLIAALALPIIALLLMTQFKRQHLQQGTLMTLAISGFDPRDLLSGHYLRYRIDYGVPLDCPQDEYTEAWVCLKPKAHFYREESDLDTASCTTWVSGYCEAGEFLAGIERFYIPEAYAQSLERQIRDQQGKVVIAINTQGEALVKELLIANQPWRESVQAQDKIP